MTSPVVVDGRLTREKLLEFLDLAAEYPALDYKRELNLDDPHHKYGLLKHLIAMSNTGQGGYVVVGANEHGKPATGFAPVRADRLGTVLALACVFFASVVVLFTTVARPNAERGPSGE